MPKDGKKDDSGLTAKQRVFCDEYVRNGCNATKAAIAAGYSLKSAQVIAAENLSKPCIYNYINSVLTQRAD